MWRQVPETCQVSAKGIVEIEVFSEISKYFSNFRVPGVAWAHVKCNYVLPVDEFW